VVAELEVPPPIKLQIPSIKLQLPPIRAFDDIPGKPEDNIVLYCPPPIKLVDALNIVLYIPPPIVDNDELKEISIFVFQKGNIIITGARRKSHIMAAYKYVNNILITHSEEISKKDEDDLILDLYNDILKDAENGLINI